MDIMKHAEIAEIITKVMQYSYNVSFEDFKTDFAKVIGGYVSDGYANEKFDAMRRNFSWFYCNLDDESKERFVDVVLAHYGLMA